MKGFKIADSHFIAVIPAQAGIHRPQVLGDPRLRGDDCKSEVAVRELDAASRLVGVGEGLTPDP